MAIPASGGWEKASWVAAMTEQASTDGGQGAGQEEGDDGGVKAYGMPLWSLYLFVELYVLACYM